MTSLRTTTSYARCQRHGQTSRPSGFRLRRSLLGKCRYPDCYPSSATVHCCRNCGSMQTQRRRLPFPILEMRPGLGLQNRALRLLSAERRVWSCRESCPRCRILCRLFPELHACVERLECRVKVESNQMERSTRTPPAIRQSAVSEETWRSCGGYENPGTGQTGCCLAICRYMESRFSRSCAGCPRGLAMVRAKFCVPPLLGS